MKFQIPVENCLITSRFNTYRDYSRIAPTKKQLHEGIDFAPKQDAEIKVKSAQKGYVYAVGYDRKGYGNYVVIKHNDRYYTWYAHLKKTLVAENQAVEIGTILGLMGNTGNSTGKHLHFTLQDMKLGLDNYVVKKVVDPLPYIVDKIDTCNISVLCYNILNRLIRT